MKDPEGVEQEFICSMAEMLEKKENGWTTVFSPAKNNLIGHTGDVISHTSSGWQDVLKTIKSKNQGSTIETKYQYTILEEITNT